MVRFNTPASNDMWGPDEGFMGGKCGPHYGLAPGIHIGASRGSPDVLKVGPVRALMSLFVFSCKDGWVSIMYDGLDAVGVNQQTFKVVMRVLSARRDAPCNEAQQRPYYGDYSPARLYIHTLCTNHYLDLFITGIICINVVTMSVEHFNQPLCLEEALKYCNYVFTIIFTIEALLKLVAFGFRRIFKDRWIQLDLAIVLLSIMGITLEEIKMNAALPINPTIIRIMRVLRIARVLKLLKMATGMRALLDTVMQALPQVPNVVFLYSFIHSFIYLFIHQLIH
ncbi:voltage-dependent T-type calcium channel subunit alpha-1H-like [Chanodichthys erythropterus]|uniref:voltage-dependent T-type calcium channel subunit alpha-1H-like n=1 Tax=Chanodichthys erythropterus TaxID=933992 RepID=UPI00351E9B89